MQGEHSSRTEWLLAAAAILVCGITAVVVGARPASTSAAPVASLPDPAPVPAPTATVQAHPTRSAPPIHGAAVTRFNTTIRARASGRAKILSWIRKDILLPVVGSYGRFVHVLTPCNVSGWVAKSKVTLYAPDGKHARMTIVLDAGHGGTQTGAIGPGGLKEKDANLALARALRGRLKDARVFLTRSGDYTASLRFRTALASELKADAFVSIHNNSVPDGPSKRPGTETWHQMRSPSSKHLAGYLQKELVRALMPFKVNWVADRKAGVRSRLGSHGHDYYAILRGSSVPTVIVEATFISNHDEEKLLRRPEGRAAIAGALAHGLKKYVATTGSEPGKSYPVPTKSSPSRPAVCVDPGW